MAGVLLVDKPSRPDLARHRRRAPPRAPGQGRPRRHPRSLRHRAADRAHSAATRLACSALHGAAEDLPDDRALRRRLRSPATATARSPRPARACRAAGPADRARSASSRPPTRRSRSAASAPTSGREGERRWRCRPGSSRSTASSSSGDEGDRAEFEIECSSGHLRPQPDRRPRRRLLRRVAAHRDRPIRRLPRPLGRRRCRLCGDRTPRVGLAWQSWTPMSIEVVKLADAKPHPRKVAIGTFDGVHVGHRKVIRGADTVLTFDPHPVSVIHPGGGAEADHALRRQARRDRGPRGRRAGRDPVRPSASPRSRPRGSSRTS